MGHEHHSARAVARLDPTFVGIGREALGVVFGFPLFTALALRARARDGGWRVICWALVLSAPVSVPVAVVAAAGSDLSASSDAWLGFAYVTAVSALLGFFAWYAGLARGGVAKIGQVQLVQPLLTLAWSAALLGERVNTIALFAAVLVVLCVVGTQRAQVGQAPLVTSQR